MTLRGTIQNGQVLLDSPAKAGRTRQFRKAMAEIAEKYGLTPSEVE